MKTDDLLDLLAADTTPVDTSATDRRLWLALSFGGLCAAILLSTTLGIRYDLDLLSTMPMFWLKLGFPAALAGAGLAGAGTGLLAGAVGAFAYAFYCPETAAPFLAIWYALGIAIPAALGALLGPRVLHW